MFAVYLWLATIEEQEQKLVFANINYQFNVSLLLIPVVSDQRRTGVSASGHDGNKMSKNQNSYNSDI